ncbi:MAG: M3 family metallopeptidase, partial [Gaiella sp.]
ERQWGLGDLWTGARHPEAAVRRRAYDALATGYGAILDVVALAWDAVVHDRVVEDQLRGRVHPAQETLEDENLPLEGFGELIEAVSARSDLQQTLLRAQAALSGIETLTVADLAAPVPDLPELGHEQVVEHALAGLASLHPVLRRDAEALYAARRVDAEPRPEKQMYAATWETRLDPPAFVAYRFTGRPSNVPLLGHELGHAVGLSRAAAAQPVIARSWPGALFEVPSNVAELAAARALQHALPEHAPGLRLLEAQDLAWSVFHAIAFCRVELDLYAARAEGTPLGGEALTGAFRTRFGEVLEPGVEVGEREALVLLGARCGYAVGARFYSYQYAVGALLALALHALRDEDPEGFGDRYVTFLGLGRSVSPTEQLRLFGLDLRRATWERGLAELERRIRELAELAGVSPSGV